MFKSKITAIKITISLIRVSFLSPLLLKRITGYEQSVFMFMLA